MILAVLLLIIVAFEFVGIQVELSRRDDVYDKFGMTIVQTAKAAVLILAAMALL